MKYFADLHILNATKLPQTPATQATLNRALTIFFMSIGAVAVLMIVVGGIRFVYARSDPNKVTQARNVILYALIGLVVSATAAAMVNNILGRTG